MKLILIALFFSTAAIAQQTSSKLTVKELDVTSRLNVTSTTKSSKPCPAMTETQRNAIATPLNGSCIYNTTTSKLNVYNGTAWKAAGGGVDNWLTATAYSVDDIVIESSKIYQCLIAHTSGTFATDLAALKWAEISSTVPVNLTGPITSVGNATSIASQTGTGSTFVVQNTPTLTTPNIGAATGTSLTLAGNLSAYNYDKDDLLTNGNIENPLGAEWTCTTGSAAATSTSGEVGKGVYGLKMTSGTGTTIRCYQTVTTLSGAPVQHYVRGFYKFLLADLPDFQICSLINGNLLANEQTCIPTASLIGDNTYRPFEIPITVTPGQSVGVVFKTTATSTAKSAFVDTLSLKQGLGFQNLQGDNTYSAQVSNAGVVSGENKDFINGNCVVTDTSLITCTYSTGIFTATPTCIPAPFLVSNTDTTSLYPSSQSSTAIAIRGGYSSGGSSTIVKAAYGFNLVCQKSGNDYLASSSNVYSQASANPVLTSTTLAAQVTSTSGLIARNTLGLLSSCTAANPTVCTFTSGLFGSDVPNCSADTYGSGVIASITNISASSVTISTYTSNTLTGVGNTPFTLTCERTGANLLAAHSPFIIGSFENVPTVPGAGARIDTFSVSYGTTNATTACSASPCSYLDQIGAGVSNITRAGAGLYTINLAKTYTKLKCTTSSYAAGGIPASPSSPMSCASCSSLAFALVQTNNNSNNDAYGVVSCQGTY